VFESVYDEFRDRFVAAAQRLRLGPSDSDDLGPVINMRQLENMLSHIEAVKERGGRILCGGYRLDDAAHEKGYYLAPTIIEGVDHGDPVSRKELFGPITNLYRAKDFSDALSLANDSDYGLTAAIHTRSFDRAIRFCHAVRTGVAVVNAGTYGSEPHMPFGGLKQSGNGTREPGTEALDIYSELKDIYFNITDANL
jgi:aldehyde dehydrogenase (NAD+)